MARSLPSLPYTETKRLHLRPLRLPDAEAFRTMTDEPTIIDTIYFLERPFRLADAEKLITSNDDGRDCFWGVWKREGPTLLGTVGTHLRGTDEVEVGYWFASASQGLGLASEAVKGVILVLLDNYPECRIIAECKPENEASWRLLERVGFRAYDAGDARPGRQRFIFVR
jgi:RimJ/RimL family protein N-acetyltransferase